MYSIVNVDALDAYFNQSFQELSYSFLTLDYKSGFGFQIYWAEMNSCARVFAFLQRITHDK